MIKNRLAIIMAEKEIKSLSALQRLIEEQGFSLARRTLDKFYHNQNRVVSYETLDVLCTVLDCELSYLLVRKPTNQ